MSGVTLYPEPLAQAAIPPGGVTMYAGVSIPVGWLACDGSVVSRTTYANLYNAIGTLYGAGDGSTTFQLPDFRGRAPIGAGTGAGLTNRALAVKGGAQDAILASHSHSHGHTTVVGGITANHTHGINQHYHGVSGGTAAASTGSAGFQPGTSSPGANAAAFNGTFNAHGHSVSINTGGEAYTGGGVGLNTNTVSSDHAHAVTVNADATAAGVSPTDGNMPPWLAINVIIKT